MGKGLKITGVVIVLLFLIGLMNEETKNIEIKKEKNIISENSTKQTKDPTLKGGYGACTSKDSFEEFTTAIHNKDEKLLDFLLEEDCFITKAGIKISILDRSFTGTAKVRAYINEESFILYTYNENILN